MTKLLFAACLAAYTVTAVEPNAILLSFAYISFKGSLKDPFREFPCLRPKMLGFRCLYSLWCFPDNTKYKSTATRVNSSFSAIHLLCFHSCIFTYNYNGSTFTESIPGCGTKKTVLLYTVSDIVLVFLKCLSQSL